MEVRAHSALVAYLEFDFEYCILDPERMKRRIGTIACILAMYNQFMVWLQLECIYSSSFTEFRTYSDPH